MTTSEDGDSSDRPRRRSKVARIIQEYDLTGMEVELVRRWTGTDGERYSLRNLADYANQELLRATIEQAT